MEEDRKLDYEEDEIDLYELWQVLVKYKRLILRITLGLTFLVAIYSLSITNIYRSHAVILPVGEKQGGISSYLSRFGGVAGISVPTGGSGIEIMALLKSEILKAEVIKQYNLLPVLLYNQWDKEKKTWKKPGLLATLMAKAKKSIMAFFQRSSADEEKDSIPTISDGIRAMEGILTVSEDRKLGTINLYVEYPDPEIAAEIIDYIIKTLRDHMSKEAIRIAQENKKILERELTRTSDPTIQQKLYALLASQVETSVMAKVNENFSFKVIDPPRVPDRKYKPKRSLMVAVAFVTGLFLSIFLAFFLEYIEKVKNKKQPNTAER